MCVRLLDGEAKWLYNGAQAPNGDQVFTFVQEIGSSS